VQAQRKLHVAIEKLAVPSVKFRVADVKVLVA
jgi:hypothetical protein